MDGFLCSDTGSGSLRPGNWYGGLIVHVGTVLCSQISLCDMIEPPDYEEVAERLVGARDPLAYPPADIELCVAPRRIRTLTHVLPDEDL